MNLEVPIELIDNNLTSLNSGAFTAESSKTNFDTGDYDGGLTYTFDISASNSDSADKDVLLVNGAGATVATATVPTGAVINRYTATLTPTSGADTYRVVVPQTTSAAQATVFTARIVVAQIQANKTRIQIPLGGTNGSFSTDLTNIIDSRTSVSYGQGTSDKFTLWNYTAANWATIAASNAFTLEAVISNSSTSTTFAALYNATDNTEVTSSIVSAAAGTDTLSLQATTFTSDVNLVTAKDYELRFKSDANVARIHRAAFYIKLTGLASAGKAEVYYRFTRHGSTSITSAGSNSSWRARITAPNYANPLFYHEACGRESSLGDPVAQAGSISTSDTSDTVTAISGSDIAFDSTTKARVRTTALTMTLNWRVAAIRTRTTGTLVWTHSLLVVATSTPTATPGNLGLLGAG